MVLMTALMLFKCKCGIQPFFSKRDLFLFLVQIAQLSALFSYPGSCRSWGCLNPETRVCREEQVGEKGGTCMGRTHLFISCIVALTATVCCHKNFLFYKSDKWPRQHSTGNTTKKPKRVSWDVSEGIACISFRWNVFHLSNSFIFFINY